MADVKWIKITTDIFDDEKILLIESLPDSYAIIVVWFKLLCLAGKQNNSGVFLMNDKIPYTDKMLSTIFRMKESTVSMALKTFEEFGMMERVDNVITIPNWGKHQNLDQLEGKKEYMRQYMQAYRKKQKMLTESNKSGGSKAEDGCKTNANVLRKDLRKANVSSLDKDIDKELDIDNISCATESHDTEQLDEFFNSIWKLYPIKKGKGQVSKTKKKVLQRIGFDELKRCVERFIRDMESENRDRKYWMHGSTFFNSGYVDYLDENCLSEKQVEQPQEEPEIEEEEVPDDEGDYIDFGAMTDEEFAEFLRVQNGRCV